MRSPFLLLCPILSQLPCLRCWPTPTVQSSCLFLVPLATVASIYSLYMSSLFLLLVLLLFRSYFRFAQGNARDYCPLGPFNDNTLLFSFHRDRCRRRQACIKPRLLSFSVVVSSLFSIPCRPFLCQSDDTSSLLYCTLLCERGSNFFFSFFMEEEFVIVAELRISAHTHTHTYKRISAKSRISVDPPPFLIPYSWWWWPIFLLLLGHVPISRLQKRFRTASLGYSCALQ